MTCLHAAVIYKTRATSLIHKLIALNYHRRILFTEFFSHTRCGYYAATATEYRQSQQVQKNIQKPHKMLAKYVFSVVSAMQTPHIAPLSIHFMWAQRRRIIIVGNGMFQSILKIIACSCYNGCYRCIPCGSNLSMIQIGIFLIIQSQKNQDTLW